MNTEYPALVRQAKERNALIFFVDESTAKSEANRGKTWSLRGITPFMRTTGNRHRLNMISAVCAEGLMRYRTFEGRLNQDMFISFLKTLVRSVSRPVAVVTDNYSAHKSAKVREFVRGEPRIIALSYLPPYSPELNPDEQVWNHVKRELARIVIRKKKEFTRCIRKSLRGLQKMTEKISSFFRLPETLYTIRANSY